MATLLIQFTPQVQVLPVATPESVTVNAGSSNNAVPAGATMSGSPVTPDSVAVSSQPSHGTVTINGIGFLYTPSTAFEGGSDSFTYTATYQGATSPPATVNITVLYADCTELGLVTRANVSAYQRGRVHHSRLVRGEKRCLVANFNGAVDPARTITGVTWRCEQPYYVGMANARIIASGKFAYREAAVDITAQLQGYAWLKCEATLDNGELYTQVFTVLVMATPYFYGEAIPTLGPYTLTAP